MRVALKICGARSFRPVVSPFEQILEREIAARRVAAAAARSATFGGGTRAGGVRAGPPQPPPSPPCLRVLGLGLPCTAAQVRRAFRQRARLVHPDRGGSHAAFVALERAYEQALALAA